MPPIVSVGNGNEIQADAAIVNDCARNNLEHGNQASMAQPPIADSSLLEDLPDEILMEVFEHLVCDENSSTDEPAYDTLTFCSLCLVSKRIDLIARPYLFKKVYINRPGTLIRLYRTIAGDQHLGGQIKAIDLDLDLDMIKLDAAERETLRDDLYKHTGQCRLETPESTRKDCDKIGILCYKLLAQAVNLSSLEMNINPDEDLDIDSDPGDMELEGLFRHENCLAFLNHVSDAIRSTADRQAAVFLPRLKTLTLCCYAGGMSVEAFEPFLALPSLRTVRIIGEPELHLNSEWDPSNVPVAYPVCKWFLFISLAIQSQKPRAFSQVRNASADGTGERWARPNITTLDLTAADVRQCGMEAIGRLFPCLEVLSVANQYYVRRRDLSTSLGKLTALRTLKLDIYPDDLILSDQYNDVTASLGPGNVLNLAQLPILQHLEVPLYMFAHIGRLAVGGTAAVPQKALPRSLKSLVLLARLSCEENSFHEKEVCWDSVDAALIFLESLRDDLPCFPHLESVAYWFESASCGNPFSSAVQGGQDDKAAEDSTLSRLQAIQASFSRHDVQFLVEEGNDRRTIDLQDLEE
ncbi:hypothetical protein SLS64_011697 [Diaporthe eres]|uniref:F-box domain-containing protein n=1 Tax=Diaporthe eres TaxID=83184 RepID=A0ABR1NQ99_DIAER